MATIKEIISGIVERLETIPDLRTSETLPGSIDPPMAVVTLDSIIYDSSTGSRDLRFTVHVFTSMASERSGLQLLYSYLDASGTRSVAAAIDADSTLDDRVMYAYVAEGAPSPISEVAGVDYFSAKFTIQVGA